MLPRNKHRRERERGRFSHALVSWGLVGKLSPWALRLDPRGVEIRGGVFTICQGMGCIHPEHGYEV